MPRLNGLKLDSLSCLRRGFLLYLAIALLGSNDKNISKSAGGFCLLPLNLKSDLLV